jgi:hypothetical protein
MAACSVAMAAVAYAGSSYWRAAEIQHVLARAAVLAVMIFVSVAVYTAMAWLLKCEELTELFLLFRRAEPGAAPAMGTEI